MANKILSAVLMSSMTLLAANAASAQAMHSIWDGVYTDAQAERGSTQYLQHCAMCHGANLAGTFEIPPLVGRFIPYFAGSTLDVLFDYTSTAMPLDHPGSLEPSVNADILAFILKTNGLPAGPKELAGQIETLKAISFDSTKPQAVTTRTKPASGKRPVH
jgi:cytochrome c